MTLLFGSSTHADLDRLKVAIRNTAATLLLLDSAGSATRRVWCLYEVAYTVKERGSDSLIVKFIAGTFEEIVLATLAAAGRFDGRVVHSSHSQAAFTPFFFPFFTRLSPPSSDGINHPYTSGEPQVERMNE